MLGSPKSVLRKLTYAQVILGKWLRHRCPFSCSLAFVGAGAGHLRADQGDEARIEIGLIKVYGASMLHNVIDRAIQVHGALGVTEDTPLERMYRHARFARIYDGADEVHIQNTGGRILRRYANGEGFDIGMR